MKNLKEAAVRIDALECTLTQALDSIQALTLKIAELEAKPQRGARDYGPKAENAMTDEMAWRIRYGDLVGRKVKEIADENGLSRGQVYSVRGNYTFTKITADSYIFEESEDEVKIVKAK